jgi:putative phosphoribosyl transferase
VAPRDFRRRESDDPLAAYRKLRKPMPPPERVDPDRRQEELEREAEEEMRSSLGHPAPADPARTYRAGGFANRREAGALLARALRDLVPSGRDTIVLAIPRGGVEVGAEVARELDAPLDVVIPRKVGAPRNAELGLGAVAEGVEVLDAGLIASLAVPEDYVRREVAAQEEEIRRRTAAYRAGRPPPDVNGKVAVVVDDGVATGGTALAALRWARARGAGRVVLAVPVAPAETIRRLRPDADDVVVLIAPTHFLAVGQWFGDFPQVSDERVIELLGAAGPP